MIKEINEEENYSIEKIDGIQIDVSNIRIKIISSKNNDTVKVNFHGKAMQEIKLVSEINNNNLFIKVKRNHEKLPIYEKVEIDVYLPANYSKDFSVNTLSSYVDMDNFGLKKFTYSTLSGNLKVDTLSAEKISMSSSSGPLILEKLITKELEIKGESSAINIDKCDTDKAIIETSSGSITLKNTSGSLNLKSSSGKILVTYNEFEEKEVNIQTTSGSINLELPNSAEFLIDAKTSTGNVQSNFPIDTKLNIDKKYIQGQIGTKNNKISLKTLSGSIKVLKK